jgi:hypothetical protein
MISLNETQVFLAVKQYLIREKWQVVGGQPPSGTDHLPVIEIRDPLHRGKGSKGSYKPDLIAWRASILAIIELKPTFNQPDRNKVNQVLNSPDRLDSLWESLIQRNIELGSYGKIVDVRAQSRVVGGLGYGGNKVDHPELWRFFVNDGEVEVTPGSFSTDH